MVSKQLLNWTDLRESVKKCKFDKCPRHKEKFNILFKREESSLSKTKYIVVSQEPGFSLKKHKDPLKNSLAVEKHLISECLKDRCNKKTPINRIKDIFNIEKFNPSTGDIYWTHALKCIPNKSDADIIKTWKCSAHYCVIHFRNELNLFSSKKIILIPIGGYALALCRNVFDNKPLTNTKGILNYIKEIDLEKKYYIEGKEISIFPFIHPSHYDQILKLRDKDGKIKEREDEFIELIRIGL